MTDYENSSPQESATPRPSHVFRWFSLAGGILILVSFFVFRSLNNLIDNSHWVAHTHELIAVLHEIVASLTETQSDQRGLVLTGDETYAARYQEAIPHVQRNVVELRHLVGDNETQLNLVKQLELAIDARLAHSNAIIQTYQLHGFASAQEEIAKGNGMRTMDEVRSIANQLITAEQKLLDIRESSTELAGYYTIIAGALALVVCGGILLFVYLSLRRETRRRERDEKTLKRAKDEVQNSYDELQRVTHEAATISAMGDYLQSCRTPHEAYSIIKQSITRLLPELSGAIGIISNSRNLVECVVKWGEQTPFLTEFHPDECWGLRRGRMHLVEGSDSCDPPCSHITELPAGYLCLPMVAHGETLGVLSLSTDREGGLTVTERRTARVFAEQACLALANQKLQEALRVQTIRDPLTGLFNRRYLEASLEREVSRSRRQQQPLGVIMIDVDHFKRFNDTHGHEGGDAVLVEFGKLLARQSRAEDIACRYGGEEFCLLMPGASLETTKQRAEELCEAVRRLTLSHNRQPLGPITISAGVAVYPMHVDSADQIIASADAALYHAKRTGRNRVVLTSDLNRSPLAPIPLIETDGQAAK